MTQADSRYVVWLDEAGEELAPLLGSKCGSLAEMIRAGFGVPLAFAVTTSAYTAFLDANGLREQVRSIYERLDPDDLRAAAELSAEMTKAIEEAPLPADVCDAIDEAYARLAERTGNPRPPVAVRSSGVSEDLAGASFAGQYETYLWIIGAEAVRTHVRRCWTGLFGDAVLTYHPVGEAAPVTGVERRMAVAVQHMVMPRAAGVMFTLDPVTGDRSKIVIEGSWGLGEAVVSGEVTPDRYRVDKVTLELLEQAVSVKEREMRYEAEGGIAFRDVPGERRAAACLEPEQVTALATLAKRIERHRGAPQDIEWAIDESGTPYVLQVRPETVWSRRPPQPVSAGKSAMDLVMSKFMVGMRAAREKVDADA